MRRRLRASLIAFGVLFARFIYLQVVQHEHYHTLAEANRISIVPVVPNRGLIIDRNGVVLAHNYSAYTLEITPRRSHDVERDDRRARRRGRDRSRATAGASEAAGGEQELREPADPHAADRRGGGALRREPLPLPRRRDQGAPVPPLPARRGRLARDRLHRPHQRQRRRSASTSRRTRPTTRAPTTSARSGIERRYERELHGTTGFEQVEIDAGGRAVRTLSRTPPIVGQQPRAVARHQAAAGRRAGVRRPPRRAGRDRARDRRRARVRLQARLRPEPVRRRHRSAELGRRSTTRPTSRSSTARCAARIRRARPSSRSWRSAALELGQAHARATITDPGFFMLPAAHRFRDDKAGGHGMVDMHKSIVVSCDTYYYVLAQRPGHRRHPRASSSQFGFGAEDRHRHRGRDRPACCRRRNGSSAALRQQKWYVGDTISSASARATTLSRRCSSRTRPPRSPTTASCSGRTCVQARRGRQDRRARADRAAADARRLALQARAPRARAATRMVGVNKPKAPARARSRARSTRSAARPAPRR